MYVVVVVCVVVHDAADTSIMIRHLLSYDGADDVGVNVMVVVTVVVVVVGCWRVVVVVADADEDDTMMLMIR